MSVSLRDTRASESARARSRFKPHALAAWVQRLVFAVIAIVVCAVVASPGSSSTRLVAAAFDAAGGPHAERDVRHFERAHPQEPSAPDLKPIELDDDDDDDSLHEHGQRAPLAFRLAPLPRKPDCMLRGVFAADTSRVVAKPELPRGPPA